MQINIKQNYIHNYDNPLINRALLDTNGHHLNEKVLVELGYTGESIHKKIDCLQNYLAKSFEVYVGPMIAQGTAGDFANINSRYSIIKSYLDQRR